MIRGQDVNRKRECNIDFLFEPVEFNIWVAILVAVGGFSIGCIAWNLSYNLVMKKHRNNGP